MNQQVRTRLFILFAIVTVSILTYFSQVQANSTVRVFIDGNEVNYETKPQILNQQTILPVRSTFDAIGAKVIWDQKNRRIHINWKNNTLDLFFDKKVIIRNNQVFWNQSPTLFMLQDTAMVSASILSDIFGIKVDWDSKHNAVIINTTSTYMYPKDLIKIPILMYHHFDEENPNYITVRPSEFEKQMEMIKNEGYETINDSDLIAFMKGEKSLPKKPIMITMDDGYLSNYTYAYPVLKKLNMKATIFIITEYIANHPRDHYYQRFNWQEAKEMYDSGVMEIQSHTYDMHLKGKTKKGEKGLIYAPIFLKDKNRYETYDEYKARVLFDLTLSKQLIETNVGNKVVSLCYPYGEFSKDSEKLVKQAGYEMTVTVEQGINSYQSGPFLLKRINVNGSYSANDLLKVLGKYK